MAIRTQTFLAVSASSLRGGVMSLPSLVPFRPVSIANPLSDQPRISVAAS
jgi:hypothetical protein